MNERPDTTGRPIRRVVVWGTCDIGKPRVRILLQGLRDNGVELIECRRDPWRGTEDKSQASAARWLTTLLRVACAYPMLAWQYLRLPRHDWVLLGYPAIPDIFVIRVLAWLRRTPVAMDWFLSAYDTVVLDRRMVGPRHPLAWLLYAAEWCAVRLPDCVFMDTAAHARRMEQLFGLREGRCGRVWVGVEAGVFGRVPAAGPAAERKTDALKVLFYGQFIPLHGVPTIVEAARLLRDEPIEFLLVGRGQESGRIRSMLDSDPLPALRWIAWLEYPALVGAIADADVCLGIFGGSDKAASVIPNKVFQVVAAGKSLVTRDSPAIRELLAASAPCAYLVPAMDAATLARVLHAIALRGGDPVRPCHAPLLAAIDAAAIGAQLTTLLASRATRGQTA